MLHLHLSFAPKGTYPAAYSSEHPVRLQSATTGRLRRRQSPPRVHVQLAGGGVVLCPKVRLPIRIAMSVPKCATFLQTDAAMVTTIRMLQQATRMDTSVGRRNGGRACNLPATQLAAVLHEVPKDDGVPLLCMHTAAILGAHPGATVKQRHTTRTTGGFCGSLLTA